ncbi:MAG TPA: PD-(D/E)XK nuclease family protein [Nitrospinota bacterium]|nr:PD-(D/E)XK nuclease family protein [Nitrospinota bacterium]
MIRISRSGVEQYLQCKRCFILNYKHSIRPRMLPFTLNIAVDNLCKNEFDHYRKEQKPHPLFIEHGIDAVPFNHPDIDKWRYWKQGIRYIDKDNGFNFFGAVDDVWVKPDGELIISDVKATSKKEFNWEKTYEEYDYAKGYQRQLEMYQWLFRKNGFKVADEAYLVYYNGLKDEPLFEQSLKFELHLIRLDCNDAWVEEKVIEASRLLGSDEFPGASPTCENCNYLKKRWKLSQNIKMK